MKNLEINLAEEVAKESVKRERRWYKKESLLKTAIIGSVILLVALIACGTVLAYHAITEQQYALNMQYAEMADIAGGTTTYEAETQGDGTAIAGTDNTTTNTVGGEDNGESKGSDTQQEKGSK